jgi:hypothetical protein
VKQKTSLLLMEQLVMSLVFALAAALCLQVFAKSVEISETTDRRDRALTLASNAAEMLKATNGDTSAAENLSRDGYRVAIISREQTQPGLAVAVIEVYFEENLILSLETGWLEVLP